MVSKPSTFTKITSLSGPLTDTMNVEKYNFNCAWGIAPSLMFNNKLVYTNVNSGLRREWSLFPTGSSGFQQQNWDLRETEDGVTEVWFRDVSPTVWSLSDRGYPFFYKGGEVLSVRKRCVNFFPRRGRFHCSFIEEDRVTETNSMDE